MEGYAYGYLTGDTMMLLGEGPKNSELKIIVSEDALNKQHIRDITVQLKAYLEKEGHQVTRIEIPRPGKHPHFDQMAALLFLMEIFGLLALLLSGVLVANLISSILEQQTRQIGIMKAIGASSLQIAGLYEAMVIVLAAAAMLVSIPAGIAVGRGYAWVAAEILNFKIYSYNIPHFVFLFEIAAGLLVPTIAAIVPILKGSRITVREAINDYGIRQEKYANDKEDFLTRSLKRLPRPFILSLRNTFRRKGRLIFTMLVIAAGGTGFIVAMNIYASMYYTVDERINAFQYDIQIAFDRPQPVETIENVIGRIQGVSGLEAWGGTSVSRVYKDGTTGNSFNIMAPPSETRLMTAPPLYSGRWLKPDDTNALVINQRVFRMSRI
jgi:putative ABC transport system permease protein